MNCAARLKPRIPDGRVPHLVIEYADNEDVIHSILEVYE